MNKLLISIVAGVGAIGIILFMKKRVQAKELQKALPPGFAPLTLMPPKKSVAEIKAKGISSIAEFMMSSTVSEQVKQAVREGKLKPQTIINNLASKKIVGAELREGKIILKSRPGLPPKVKIK